MKKKNEIEKVCLCGRIITDSKNKTGLCPKCQKTGGNALGVGVLTIIFIGVKKYGPKVLQSMSKFIKK